MFYNAKDRHCKVCKSQQRRERTLQIEALEQRELLTVSPLYADASDDIPAVVAPLSASENVSQNHEIVADLNASEEPQSTENAPVALYADNYNFNDLAKVRTFLEQTNLNGVKNGEKVNSAYNSSDPATWTGVTWTKIGNVMCVTAIDFNNKLVIGDLDVTGCNNLMTLNCNNALLTSINVSGCAALATLNCNKNVLLTSVDASECTSLTTLDCSYNPLTELNIAGSTALTSLDFTYTRISDLDLNGFTSLTTLRCCYTDGLQTLDISGCTGLTSLYCYGIGTLNKVILPSERSGDLTINIAAAYNDDWTIKDENGNTLKYIHAAFGEGWEAAAAYILTPSDSSPFYATESSRQTIFFYYPRPDALQSPALDFIASYSGLISVAVGGVSHASEYTLQYSTTSEFTNPTTQSVSAGTTIISGLNANTTYYFRVRANGSDNYSASDYSATVSASASSATPYNAHDLACLYEFLEQTDENGVKNGMKIYRNPSNNNITSSYPPTGHQYYSDSSKGWGLYYVTDKNKYGIIWSVINGERRITEIVLDSRGSIAGSFDFSGCTELTNITFPHSDYGSSITSVNLSGCTALTSLDCSYSQLTSLNLSGCTALTSLDCSNNQLTSLDLSKNTALTTLKCGNSTLNYVSLPSVRTSNLYIYTGAGSDTNSIFKDANGNILGTSNSSYLAYTLTPSTALPVYAINEEGSQTITFNNPFSLTSPTLSVDKTSSSSVSVTVGSVENATGYSLQYSTNSDFSNADTMFVSSGTTNITGLNENTTYYFRVMATGTGNYSNSDYSETQSIYLSLYNANDVAKLRAFFEQLDINGKKNGLLGDWYGNYCDNESYNTNDPSTWGGVVWTLVDGEMRLTEIDITDHATAGDLNLSGCDALTRLDVVGSYLTSLDVSGCTALTELYCSENELTSIDVSGCETLTVLWCDDNHLTTLDASDCNVLTELWCGENEITSLDLSGCPSVKYIYFYEANSNLNSTLIIVLPSERLEGILLNSDNGNEWTFTDANGNSTNGDWIYIGDYSGYYYIDTTAALPINASDTDNNHIVSFIASSKEQLPAPTISVSKIDSESVSVTVGTVANASEYSLEYSVNSDFSNAETMFVSSGTTIITGLNANTTYYFRVMATGTGNYSNSEYSETKSAKTDLVYNANDLACIRAFLEQTDSNGIKNGVKINSNYSVNNISSWTGVTWKSVDEEKRVSAINWNDKQLAGSMNLSNCSALTSLKCHNGELTSLNVSGCFALTDINCSNNQLTTLDVSCCTLLKGLNCSANQLVSLDFSNNTALTNLFCFSNQLTYLDVSKCTSLIELYCRTNQLPTLDVSKNVALEILYCHDNQLKSLNVTNNLSLTTLGCRGNQLSVLNLSNNSALATLDCWNSTLNTVVLPSEKTNNIEITLSLSSRTNWIFKDVNNTTLGTSAFENNAYTPFNLEQSIALPVYANNANGTQTIEFTDALIEHFEVQNDYVCTAYNTPATINYRSNDDVENWSLLDVDFGGASYGSFTVNNDGTITYTPDSGFFGTDVITYGLFSPSGEMSLGSIVISVELPIAASVRKTSDPTASMASSADTLTDWDSCSIDLWAHGVNELNAGETTVTLSYNPAVYAAASFSSGEDGIALSASNSVLLPDGNVQVELTLESTQVISSQSDNLYLGTIVLTPSTKEGAGVENTESVCTISGQELSMNVQAMPFDLVRDNTIDVSDFEAFSTVFGLSPRTMSPEDPLYDLAVKADFNHDGNVNTDDYILFAQNYGMSKESTVNAVSTQNTSLLADENIAPKHELITDLTYIDKTGATPARAAIDYIYFYKDYCYFSYYERDVDELNGALTLSAGYYYEGRYYPLAEVNYHGSNLTSLNVSGCTALEVLDCHSSRLNELNVTGCTALEELICYDNQLKELNVSGCTALEELICYDNQLKELNVSGCTALKTLSCNMNQLKELDVTKNTALKFLYCSSNQLKELNVTKNSALEVLHCYINQLTELDVSKNTALRRLDCIENHLQELDLTKNTALDLLFCWNSTLKNVLLPSSSERAETLIICLIQEMNWTIKDTNGIIVTKGPVFSINSDTQLPVIATNDEGTQTIIFGEKTPISIIQESLTIEDQSGTRSIYTPYEGEQAVEDAFVGKLTSIQAVLQLPDSCNTKEDAIKEITSFTLDIFKKFDDNETYNQVDHIYIEQTQLEDYAYWDESKHQLTIKQFGWLPPEEAFGNIRVTCIVETANGERLKKEKEGQRIGVTEYDVSFGRATIDYETGGVNTKYEVTETGVQELDIEHSFDRNISTVRFMSDDIKITRLEYDQNFLDKNKTKKQQWNYLVNFIIDNDLITINNVANGYQSFKGYDSENNAITKELANYAKAKQLDMIGSLLEFFSDYHFYVLLGKETNNTYDNDEDNYIDNPESDIMRTIYVPSLADTTDYSANDANVEIMARTIAYVDWQKLSENETRPGSLVIYSKWHQDSSTPQYQNIAGGGEIILTPYVVALAIDTSPSIPPGSTDISYASGDFQGYGLMNANYSANKCEDNFFISRGTEPISFDPETWDNDEDWITDATYSGVGYEQYKVVKQDVINWIRNLQDDSVTLTGHSLGGALTQWFAYGSVDQGIHNKIKKITTFNAAGITNAAAEIFNRHDAGIDIDHYISNGDVISFAGEKFIGTENTTNVHLVTYRLDYTNLLNGKKVDLLGREVNEDGFLYLMNDDGSRVVSKEYGSFDLGYKHGMWLANAEWRDSFSKDMIISLGNGSLSSASAKIKAKYCILENKDISIDTLNSYWFHWTQTGYLFAINTQIKLPSWSDRIIDYFFGGRIGNQTYLSGTTEQTRQRVGLLAPLFGNMGQMLVNYIMITADIEDPKSWIDLVRSFHAVIESDNFARDHMPDMNTFPGFDTNGDRIQNQNEWWLRGINRYLYFNKKVIKTDGTIGDAALGVGELSTLSGMKFPVALLYVYPKEQAPRKDEDCLLNGIYSLKAVPKDTPFGVYGTFSLFTLAEDADFIFTSTTYSSKMNNDTVELKADVLKLNGLGVAIDGKNYSEKTSGSSLDLTSLNLQTGFGQVLSVAADVSGKKLNLTYAPRAKAFANADLTITLNSLNEYDNFDKLFLENAKINFGYGVNEVTATGGTFNGQPIKSAKLLQFDDLGITWKVSEIVSEDGRKYEYKNRRWVLPAKKTENSDINFGFQSGASPAAPIAAYAPQAMSATVDDGFQIQSSADDETRILAFSWSNSIENPDLLFKVGNTVYTESEMIANGYLLLYTKSDTFRNYIITDSAANVVAWQFDSNVNLNNVQVSLQTYEGDITPPQVTSVNAVISNDSKVNVTFTVENMSYDSVIEMAVRQTGETEDVLNLYVPVSMMTQTSGGYSYSFDLADFNFETGDYEILAWSDESMRENASYSGSFRATIESALSLSQSSFQFANTNAMQESAAQQLTISNTGNGKAYVTLSLANLEEVTGSDFTISGVYSNGDAISLDCIELAAGESVTLDIKFTPQSEGAKSWTVELLNLDDSEKRGEFTLSGTGLPLLPTEVAIEADEISSNSIAFGDPLYVTGTLKNIGTNISDAITVSLYASQNPNDLSSGLLLNSYEGIVMDGESEVTVPFYINSTIDLSVGNWYFGFVISCTNDATTSNNVSAFSDPVKVLPISAETVLQNVSATPVDENHNGLYDILKVSGSINAQTAGTYTIIWSVWDSDSMEITEAYQDYTLRKGVNTVTVNFDASAFVRHGVNGPYTISARVISDQCVWDNSNLYTTNSFNVNQFESGRLAVPMLSVVVNGSNSVLVTIENVDNATEFTLEYANNSSFINAEIMNVSAGSFTISNLNENSKYYFRVKSNGTGNYLDSEYSSVQTAIIGDVFEAQNDFVTTVYNTPVKIDYRYDDAANWSLTEVRFGNSNYGSFNVNDDGTITYTPNSGYFGADAIPYGLFSSTGNRALASIVINVDLPITASVQKTTDIHTESTAMAPSVPSLTDWESCYIELWVEGVTALSAGKTSVILSYDPEVYEAPQFASCADGVALSVSNSVQLPDGSAQVELTIETTQNISSQTDNLFLGTVVLTPLLGGASNPENYVNSKPICSLNGADQSTTVEAMPFDLVRNDVVDVNDFISFATVFGLKPGEMSPDNPQYAQALQADFNKDGIVNVEDFISFATNFGASKAAMVKPIAQSGSATEQVRNEDVDNSEFGIQNVELFDSQVETSETGLATPVVQPASPISQSSPCGESVIPFASLTPLPPPNHSQLETEAYSAALLDLYDNQNESVLPTELSAKAVDESILIDDDSFDFLFDNSDSDADDSSDVDLSAVLDELELELA